MVSFSAIALTVASVAAVGNAAALFLVTNSLYTNNKLSSRADNVLVYDNNAVNPCASGNSLQGFCSTAPSGKNFAFCQAKYNGTQPWEQVIGLFQNTTGPNVDNGQLVINLKKGNGPHFNVTNDSHCSKYTCSAQDSKKTIKLENIGFRCIYP